MKRITTDEVKKLPVGSRVDIVFDKNGQRRKCTLHIMAGMYRVLDCKMEDGTTGTYPIISYGGAHYEVEE